MPIAGIDIGVRGAIALLSDDGELQEVWDMPCLNDGPKARRTINAALFAELVYKTHATRAFIERVGPRPGEGAVGAFAFGDCNGVIRGVLAAVAIPVQYIMPAQWKRLVGIPPGKAGAKDAARSEAIRRWPGKAGLFRLVQDHGKAEAALIAVAGMLRESSTLIRRPREPKAAE